MSQEWKFTNLDAVGMKIVLPTIQLRGVDFELTKEPTLEEIAHYKIAVEQFGVQSTDFFEYLFCVFASTRTKAPPLDFEQVRGHFTPEEIVEFAEQFPKLMGVEERFNKSAEGKAVRKALTKAKQQISEARTALVGTQEPKKKSSKLT